MGKQIVFTLLLIGTFNFAYGQTSDGVNADGLPSPYFVDELHCSGVQIPDIHEGWLLSTEEVEPARKVEQAEMCDQVLRVFGIEKFTWLSPDDLERTATLIRQSGYFKETELSIRKSELKNHVHIFLTVKPGPKWTQSIAEDFRMYASKDGSGPRYFNQLSGEFVNHRFSPVSTAKLGFDVRGTTADHALNADETQLAPDDIQKFRMKNQYLAQLYFINQGQINRYLSYDLGLTLASDKTYSDGRNRLNAIGSGDLLLTKHLNIVNGMTYVGPAFLMTTYSPYEIPSTNASRGVFLPGFVLGYDYGQQYGNNMKFKFAYYNSSANQSILQMNFDFQRSVNLLHSSVVAGFKERNVKNAVLPEDRFPLSAAFDSDAYIGLAKVFHTEHTTQQVSAVFGNEELEYSTSTPDYSVNSNYVGLRYKVMNGTWDVNLAATYYFQRLY